MSVLTMSQWMARGLPMYAAEALEDLCIAEEDFEQMSMAEAMDKILAWNGIQGFTDSILGTIWALHASYGKELH